MTEKVKISQKEFDEFYEIDKSEEPEKEKLDTVLSDKEQKFDDDIEDMQEWGSAI